MKKLTLLAVGCIFAFASNAQNAPVNTQLIDSLHYAEELSDVWGYADTAGNEYALVGVYNGFSVVNVTVPSAPVEEFFIPGKTSIWRDIKTWDHYAYVMHDAGGGRDDGLLIVDLDSMTNPTYDFMYPKIQNTTGTDSITRSHNLWIDENGVLYVFGANYGLGGALMYDVATDPWNPAYLGVYNAAYLHDGYVRGDTLWGAALSNGLAVVDVSNKAQPSYLSQFFTPNTFAHNCWLSDDGKTLFTTDEVSGGFIGVYDVQQLSNVNEVDRFRVQPNNQTIPHNAHVYGDFVVTSYYTYGLQILDAQDPAWVMEVGSYDSSPFSGDGFHGAWGAYPFLPSGNVLVTDIEVGLFIVEASYTRAARVYAYVVDSVTGLSLPAADVYLVQAQDSVDLDPSTAGFKRATVGSSSDSIYVKLAGYTTIKEEFNYTAGLMDTVYFKLIPEDISADEYALKGVSMFPNPATDRIEIQSEQNLAGAELSVTDMTGKIVMITKLSGLASEEVNLDLSPGVYTVKVSHLSSSWTEKLVVR